MISPRGLILQMNAVTYGLFRCFYSNSGKKGLSFLGVTLISEKHPDGFDLMILLNITPVFLSEGFLQV